jgi:hydrogenase nickel incorporation protein HypA/HybF
MHEVGIVKGIVETAVETAQAHGAQRIAGVSVVLGRFTHVTEESFRFHFEIMTEGTVAERAAVEIRIDPGRVTCLDCEAENPALEEPVCPTCGSMRVMRSGGDQCYLETIDIDDPVPGESGSAD